MKQGMLRKDWTKAHIMKHYQKSASKCTATLLFLGAFLLSACSQTGSPHWLTGEPGDDVLSEPRVVGKPNAAQKAYWPNLADVPTQRPVFQKEEDVEKKVVVLRSEQMKAQSEMERIRNIQLGDGQDVQDVSTPPEHDDFTFSALKP
jgi:hypothetical protein